jgi:NAD(P) transhydrogenase subunit alpha
LAAIGAASSLGAIVRATDPRPEVADQVKSIGGTYLKVEVEEEMKSSDGYAKATSEAYNARAAEIYTEQARDVDIIITTALIPGRPAPKLLTAEDVAAMKPGSVIVDMAAGQGGNVEGSSPGNASLRKTVWSSWATPICRPGCRPRRPSCTGRTC